jgi:hypothetical protein
MAWLTARHWSSRNWVLAALWFWRQLPAMREAVRPRYVELGIIIET